MILFVNNNSGILFLSSILVSMGRFIKITSINIYEYITNLISVEDSV